MERHHGELIQTRAQVSERVQTRLQLVRLISASGAGPCNASTGTDVGLSNSERVNSNTIDQ